MNTINETDAAAPAEHWLSKSSLARAFDVSQRTVCRWIDAGAPALDIAPASGGKRGKRVLRFRVSEVRVWLADCAARQSLNLPKDKEK